MSNQFPHLFTPGKIGNVEIKNRICKAPQTSGLSHMDGSVSERLVRYYEDLAKGEVGMIIVEYAYVDRLYSKSASNQLASVTMNTSLAWDGWPTASRMPGRFPASRSSTADASGSLALP